MLLLFFRAHISASPSASREIHLGRVLDPITSGCSPSKVPTARLMQGHRKDHAPQRTLCRAMIAALGKCLKQLMRVAPKVFSRLAHVKLSWTPCFSMCALPGLKAALDKRSEKPVSVAPEKCSRLADVEPLRTPCCATRVT